MHLSLAIFVAEGFNFTTCQVKLHITENALRLIAKKAMAKNTGARGLRAILEDILTESMFEVIYIHIYL